MTQLAAIGWISILAGAMFGFAGIALNAGQYLATALCGAVGVFASYTALRIYFDE